MKLTAKERAALEMMRQLDARQRDEIVRRMRRDILANDVTRRVGRVRKLRIVPDVRVEGAYGLPKPKKAPGRKRGK